jgi:fluoroquinolone transport system ATP-binding protein
MKMISVTDVYLKYPGAKTDTIRGVSFDVKQGEIFGFLGPSGAGKSTLQKISNAWVCSPTRTSACQTIPKE